MSIRSIIIFACSSAAAAIAIVPAMAAISTEAEITEMSGAEAEYAEAEPIIITGTRFPYVPQSTRSATKTQTDLANVPQSITVVTGEMISDQALHSIGDVLNYVPGTSPGTGEGNRDQITLRGNATTADFFVDGIRDDVQYYRDLYNVERIEVLKGPNAMIFGRGGGGGVVNRVIKRSNLASDYIFSASGDSYSGYRVSGDIDQLLSNSIGLRLNSFYENGESFRRNTGLERYAINPTIGIAASENTRIDIAYEYLHDRRTTDRGIPANGSQPLRGYRRTFFGDPDLSYAKADVHLATFAIEQQLGENVSIRNHILYADYDKFYQNVFPSDYVEATHQIQLSAYNNSSRRDNLFSQTDLVWDVKSGNIRQTILFGFELGRQKSFNRRYNGFFQPADTPSLLVSDDTPTIDASIIFRPVNTNAGRTPASFNNSKAAVAAIYAQDQIRISDLFEIIAGVRVDRFSLDVKDLNNGQIFSRTDTLFSPRIGLVAKPLPNLSLYASYSRSWLPSAGDQFGSLDITTEALKPEKFDNVEAGVKWEPGKNLLATVAIYQLDRTNTRATDPVTHMTVLTGAQRSRGIELGLQGNIMKNWQISAGYALQNAKITRSTIAAPKGREVPLVPCHQFSLWNRYDISDRLGFGLGIIARSKTFASISNAVTLPDYARVDAAIFYTVVQGVEMQLNIENVFGDNYFATAHNDNNIAPGAPTTGRITLNLHF